MFCILWCKPFLMLFPIKMASARLCEDLTFVAIELLATQFLNDVDAFNEPLLLVLDDCHCLSDACLETLLNLLLKHRPKQLHLLLIGRNALSPNVLQPLRGEPFWKWMPGFALSN